ncbi:MAG: phosphotransferase [Propionibacteriaceae bacterium]|jgi:5-methylthioribose kinase|nr:phosphotransferase [Propionibacteriaceae bacterium]
MPNFTDLSPDLAVRYLRQETDLFRPETPLHVHEIDHVEGEGFVNHLYKVWDDGGRAVIVKQAKPYFSFFGPDADMPITVSRNRIEADAYRLRSLIVPQYILPLIKIDPGNNLFVQECWHRPTLRSQFRAGLLFPHFPAMIGQYIARSAFYTSELYLDQSEHQELGSAFNNVGMRRVLEDVLFSFQSIHRPDQLELYFATHHDFVPALLADDDFMVGVLELRDAYLKRNDCLVHGDLHTSNIMIDQDRMAVFDMEYAHLGSYSTDLGYLMGNLIFPYIAMLFHHQDWPAQRRQDFRRTVLGYAVEIMDCFLAEFEACWRRDAKPLYRDRIGYLPRLMDQLVPDVAGLMALQSMNRAFYPGAAQDYELIPDGPELEQARALTVLVGLALVKGRRGLRTMADVVDLIERTVGLYEARALSGRGSLQL